MGWLNFFVELRFYTPVLAIYFASLTGSLADASIAIAVIFFSSALFEVPTGVVSDRLGRRGTAIAMGIAAAFSALSYALAGDLVLLVVGACFDGLRRALASGSNEALLYESLQETDAVDSYAHHFGRFDAKGEMGLMVAGPVGSLVAALSLRSAVWISVVPPLIAAALAFRLREPDQVFRHPGNVLQHVGDSIRLFRSNARFRSLAIISALNVGINDAVWNLRSPFLASVWPIWMLGFSQLLGNGCTAASGWHAGAIIRRLGAMKALLWNGVVQRLIAVAAYGTSTVLSPVLIALIGLGYGVRRSGESALIQREVTAEQRATLGSFVSLAGKVVLGVIVILFGVAADYIGIGPTLLGGQALFIVPMAMLWGFHRRLRRSSV